MLVLRYRDVKKVGLEKRIKLRRIKLLCPHVEWNVHVASLNAKRATGIIDSILWRGLPGRRYGSCPNSIRQFNSVDIAKITFR